MTEIPTDLLILGAVICLGAGAVVGMVIEARRAHSRDLEYIELKHIPTCDVDPRLAELMQHLRDLERSP
jgi:hypothetical protein